ncbi:MHC class II regulatory factor RFX1 [Rhea pennata]|uniref:MHC class II regulatory factor RFX1 n=1 Tax=Rhea pennata TaxID=8795 RepID=UPI002E262BE7
MVSRHDVTPFLGDPSGSIPEDPGSSIPGDPPCSVLGDPSGSIPEDPGSSIPGDPPCSILGDPSGSIPEDPGSSIPGDPPCSILGDPSGSIPEDPGSSIPGDPSCSILGDPSGSIPEDPGSSIPGDPPCSVLGDPSGSIPEDPGSSIPGDPSCSILGDPGGSIPEDPGSSIPGDPPCSTLGDPSGSIPEDPGSSIPGDPSGSVPEDPGSSVLGDLPGSVLGDPGGSVLEDHGSSVPGDPPCSLLGYPSCSTLGDPGSSVLGDPPGSVLGDPTSSVLGDPSGSILGESSQLRPRDPNWLCLGGSSLLHPQGSDWLRPSGSLPGDPSGSILGDPTSSIPADLTSSIPVPPARLGRAGEAGSPAAPALIAGGSPPKKASFVIVFPAVGMATQAYVTELQAAQQPPPPPPQQPAAAPAPAAPYAAELPSAPAAPAAPAAPPAPAPQQYIVVTVSEGAMRPSDTVSEAGPGAAAAPAGVPTQVVQQVQATQQRLLVQAKPAAVSPLQIAGVPVPQQRSPAQTSSSAAKPGAVPQLQVHGVQPVPVAQERPAAPQTPEPGAMQQPSAPGPAPGGPEVQQLPPVPVPVQHVYPGPVQYVEGGDASYAASAIRSGAYPYGETPLYTQNAAGGYYEAAAAVQPGTPATSQAAAAAASVPMYVSGGQIVANAGSGGSGTAAATGTYVIQGGYVLGSAGQAYSHTTRASPATVQWLLDNYETAEGVSLPRSTLYCHYLLHCQEQKLEPVNAASFGKLIRSVFMGLRTRRLGTRGNSKYHYYGLRIKGSSPLLRLMEDQQHLAMRQQPFSQKQRLKPIQKMEGMTNGVAAGQQQPAGLSDISAQVQQYQQFLDASRSLADFSELDPQGKPLPEGASAEDLKAFQALYREHCEAIVDVMVNLQFTLVETLWKTFWRFDLSPPSEAASGAVHAEAEKRLPKSCLVALSKYEPVLKWAKDCDNVLYQGLVEILIPDVLRPIPSALTQAIRNFAKSLESWLTNAMMNIPEEMVRVKVAAASAFAQTLRRYTSLNHLAQAARAVLQNTAQINQMLSDLNRVDFANVQEQASWVCRCQDRLVQRLEHDFKATLQQQNSLEQWAAWLDGVVTQVLKPYQGSAGFPKAAKLFLLKWSFYSSMVIRDLTLRSAASFGSFHLIRLLYDEYMYYLVEHRVAQAKGETPIAVMGEFANLTSSLNSLDPDKDEEEEEEEESDEEMPQEISLNADEPAGLAADPMEPPAKLARADSRGIFVQALPSS